MTLYTDDDVQIAVNELDANGARPGYGLHSWRCEDRERYPEPCTCVEETARDILDAVLPAIRKRWEEDVEAGGLPLVEHDRALILALADEYADNLALDMVAVQWLRRKAEETS